jgi:eukaryotic-like serine/threonine-protein kinase
MALEIRSLLHNRYRIEQIIAQGGMGAIYQAVDESLGVKVAVKENLFSTEESTRQFRREATMLAGLRHPNLPRVTDHFVIPDQGQYLVMDFIEGDDLKQLIAKRGRLVEDEAVLIGATICDALTYLHTRQPEIVHRDIKPGNIKVAPDEQVYLVDFGLAKESSSGQSTTLGAQALTPGFAPPEQYGTGTDPRSDIYSLGATLFAALAGQIPEDALARAMGSAELTPLRKYNPAVSERTAAVIEKAMAVDINQRYQTAEEFKQALLNANTIARQKIARLHQSNNTIQTPAKVTAPLPRLANVPPAPPAQTPSQPAARSSKPLIVLLIGGIALVGLMVVVVGFLVGSSLLGGASRTPTLAATLPLVIDPTETTQPEATETSAPTFTIGPSDTPPPEPTLTPEFTATSAPVVTPIGGGQGQIAFTSDRSGLPQIWILDVGSKDVKQVTNLPDGACQPDWSPDGKRLVITSPCKSKQDIYKNAGLFLINADGSGLEIIHSKPGGDYDPAWSPDGNRIAFTSIREGLPHIFVFDLKEKTTIRLSSQSTRDNQPVWSPDGKLIAFQTTRQGQSQIWTIEATDITGKSAAEFSILTNGASYMPDWSHDGQTIIFSQGPDLPWLVARQYPPRNSPEVRIAEQNRPVYTARFSLDNLWIAFEGVKDGNHDLFLMLGNGSSLARLTDDLSNDFQPSWQPPIQ